MRPRRDFWALTFRCPPCSALPGLPACVPALSSLSLSAACLLACLPALRWHWQLAVGDRGGREEGGPAWACIIRPGWARSSHRLRRRIIFHVAHLTALSVSLDLSVCHSSSRCSRSFLPSRVSYNTHTFSWLPLVSDLRPCLTSRPTSPPTPSPAWASSLDLLSPHLSWATFPFTNNAPQAQASHFIADSYLHRLHLHLPRIASPRLALHGITSNIHTPLSLPDSGPSPCIRLPDPAASRASRPYQPPRPNPHLCPAVQRTDRRRALLRVAAAPPAPVRPSPPSVSPLAPEPPGHPSVIIHCLPSTARLVDDQIRPSRVV